jgi:hypothetical protein
MAGKKNTEELLEFDSSSGVSTTADPYASGDSSRSADKSAGESSYSDSTKSEVLNAIMSHIGGMNKDALVNIYKAYGPTGSSSRAADNKSGEGSPISLSPTSVKYNTGNGPAVNTGGSAPTVKSSQTGKGEQGQLRISQTAVKPSYKEDVEEIFGGDELSEEIKNKASIVFEAAVNARLVIEAARLEEEFETRLEEAIEETRTEIVENVDKYLTYAVEEWVEENRVAIDSGLKVEMAEDLISGLKGLFESNYIDIPETKVDVVAEMTEQVEELEKQLNEQLEKNRDLKEKNTALKVKNAFVEMTEGLAETQVEKLRTLSEGVSYDSAKDYKNKLKVIKETYFPTSPKAVVESTVLTEEFSSESEDGYVEPTSGPMAAYVKAATKLSKTANQ